MACYRRSARSPLSAHFVCLGIFGRLLGRKYNFRRGRYNIFLWMAASKHLLGIQFWTTDRYRIQKASPKMKGPAQRSN